MHQLLLFFLQLLAFLHVLLLQFFHLSRAGA
jgi:hypothetical protein